MQDPENIEITINLERKNEPSENKDEIKKFIKDDRDNYVNINRNIDTVEIKNMSKNEVEFIKKVPSYPRDRLKRQLRDRLKRRLTKQKKTTMLCS